MGLLDSIGGWLKREKADIDDALDELGADLDADLSRKERVLNASPEERLAIIQSEIADDPFAEIRDRIEATTAKADAVESLADSNSLPGIEVGDTDSDLDPPRNDPPSDDPPPDEA